MDRAVLEALWSRCVAVSGTVARRSGGAVFVAFEGQAFAKAYARAVPGWDPQAGDVVELAGAVGASSEHADRRATFSPLFARAAGTVVALYDDVSVERAFPDVFPPRETPAAAPEPELRRPAWLATLAAHGLIDPAVVDTVDARLDPAAVLIETYDREPAFTRGVLCYGRWRRDTGDPIADLARIAGAPPELFRTIELDPEDAERAVFESRVGAKVTRHTVELTVDLSSVVARINHVLARAGVDRRVYGATTDAADLYVARTPGEVEALRAAVPELALFDPA